MQAICAAPRHGWPRRKSQTSLDQIVASHRRRAMDTVNIYDAKTRLSQLVDKAAAIEPSGFMHLPDSAALALGLQRRVFDAHAQSSAMVLRSTPMASTSTSTTSPGFMNTGGLRLLPTPPGVPVTITSPGNSGTKLEM